MLKKLARQLSALRHDRGLSRVALASLAEVDRATITALEAGGGTMVSLAVVAAALDHVVSPQSTALTNKRKWLMQGTRAVSAAAQITRPTLQNFESDGGGRVATFEAICTALDEEPLLRANEATWWTPPELVQALLQSLGVEHFDLDPASPDPPTVPCTSFYSERDGGLWLPWRGVTFVNPPYHDVPRWLTKAATEYESGRASLVLALVPYRPETNAWKTIARSGAAVFVLEDRLRFGGRSYISPSVSAVIVWGGAAGQLQSLSQALPRNHRLVPRSTPNPDTVATAQ